MKKMISLLAAALLATTFAAGCAKFTKCEEAKDEKSCSKDNFEKDKFNCKWEKKVGGKEGEGTCVVAEKTDLEKAQEACDAAAVGTDNAAKKVACNAKAEPLAGKKFKCNWIDADNKCKAEATN